MLKLTFAWVTVEAALRGRELELDDDGRETAALTAAAMAVMVRKEMQRKD